VDQAGWQQGTHHQSPAWTQPFFGGNLGGPIINNKLFFFKTNVERNPVDLSVGGGGRGVFKRPTAAGLGAIAG